MITIGANGRKIHYGIKHYNLDTEQDLINLPTTNEYTGCTCFVISTSKYYMLNSDNEWIEIQPFGKGGNTSSGGGGGDIIVPPGDDDDPVQDDVIYDGGWV